jgi:flagellar biosynthesis chaperone FliJ
MSQEDFERFELQELEDLRNTPKESLEKEMIRLRSECDLLKSILNRTESNFSIIQRKYIEKCRIEKIENATIPTT